MAEGRVGVVLCFRLGREQINSVIPDTQKYPDTLVPTVLEKAPSLENGIFELYTAHNGLVNLLYRRYMVFNHGPEVLNKLREALTIGIFNSVVAGGDCDNELLSITAPTNRLRAPDFASSLATLDVRHNLRRPKYL